MAVYVGSKKYSSVKDVPGRTGRKLRGETIKESDISPATAEDVERSRKGSKQREAIEEFKATGSADVTELSREEREAALPVAVQERAEKVAEDRAAEEQARREELAGQTLTQKQLLESVEGKSPEVAREIIAREAAKRGEKPFRAQVVGIRPLTQEIAEETTRKPAEMQPADKPKESFRLTGERLVFDADYREPDTVRSYFKRAAGQSIIFTSDFVKGLGQAARQPAPYVAAAVTFGVTRSPLATSAAFRTVATIGGAALTVRYTTSQLESVGRGDKTIGEAAGEGAFYAGVIKASQKVAQSDFLRRNPAKITTSESFTQRATTSKEVTDVTNIKSTVEVGKQKFDVTTQASQKFVKVDGDAYRQTGQQIATVSQDGRTLATIKTDVAGVSYKTGEGFTTQSVGKTGREFTYTLTQTAPRTSAPYQSFDTLTRSGALKTPETLRTQDVAASRTLEIVRTQPPGAKGTYQVLATRSVGADYKTVSRGVEADIYRPSGAGLQNLNTPSGDVVTTTTTVSALPTQQTQAVLKGAAQVASAQVSQQVGQTAAGVTQTVAFPVVDPRQEPQVKPATVSTRTQTPQEFKPVTSPAVAFSPRQSQPQQIAPSPVSIVRPRPRQTPTIRSITTPGQDSGQGQTPQTRPPIVEQRPQQRPTTRPQLRPTPSPTTPSAPITTPPGLGLPPFKFPDFNLKPFGGAGSARSFRRSPARTQPVAYTPTVYSVVSNLRASSISQTGVKTGLGLRPIVATNKKKRKQRGLFI